MVKIQCFKCQTINEYPDKPGFRDDCTKCGQDVRCCKNCDFFDPKVYNECREPNAEIIRERDRSNRCDYFTGRGHSAPGNSGKSPQDLLAAAEALFRKK